MQTPPVITAIVVTYNSAGVLAACLKALTDNGAGIIVVDNASSDDTVAVAETFGVTVIRNTENLGYGRANNIGVRAASSEFVLIINPDAVLDAGALTALLATARAHPEAGLYAPRIFELDGREFFRSHSYLTPGRGPLREIPPEGDVCTSFILGACLLMRRDVFLDMGGFDENIFLFYEDDDLCYRLVQMKRALIYVHDAVARHTSGGSSKRVKGTIYLVRFHQAWSKAYVARKYGRPSPVLTFALINGLKYLGARLSGKRDRMERYGGSFMGAVSAWRGRSAWDFTRLPR